MPASPVWRTSNSGMRPSLVRAMLGSESAPSPPTLRKAQGVLPHVSRLELAMLHGGGALSAVTGLRRMSTNWPELSYREGRATYATLRLWTQIVGKIRLVQTPWLNHSWHVPLYLTARGLATSPIPIGRTGLQIDFDFIDHVLWVRTSDGHFRQIMLAPKSIAEFYAEVFAALAELGLDSR